MRRGSECHSLNGRYSLRRNIVPTKRLQDYHVEEVSLAKKKCTRARTNGTTGDKSSQAPFHLPVSTVDHSSGRLILRIKIPQPQKGHEDEHAGHCGAISDPFPSSTQEGFQCASATGGKPTQPMILREEQADTVQAAKTGRCALAEEKCGITKAPEALEIANILLGLGQHVYLQQVVQQAGSTSHGAAIVQERGEHQEQQQDHTYCKVPTISGHVASSAINGHGDSSESKGRRKKQANPCQIVRRKVQPQDIKALHAQTGHESISRSGLNIQPRASNGHLTSGESKGRRKKQANPRHIVPRKVQSFNTSKKCKTSKKQDFKVLYVPQPALLCSDASFAGLPNSLNELLGLPQMPCHGLIRGRDQLNDGEKFSPQDIDIPFEWSPSPREEEDMFFPHLNDSSYKAEAAERKRREAALQTSLRQMKEPLDERYIKNAAVLPDLRQPIPAPALAPAPALIPNPTPKPSFSTGRLTQPEPLKIHGCNVEDFKRIYHSVVDPKLTTKSGNPHPYGLQMGRVIKQRMWETFHCPSFLESEGADGRVWISEAYCSAGLRPHAPVIDVDISGEPMPEKPKRNRDRQ